MHADPPAEPRRAGSARRRDPERLPPPVILASFVLALLLAGCSSPPAPTGNANDNANTNANTDNTNANTPDNGTDPSYVQGDIYMLDPTEDKIATVAGTNYDGTDYTREVPTDQILLMFEADIARTTAEATIRQMETGLTAYDLQQVGQIPDVGIYQLAISNDETEPTAAITRLETVCEQLRTYPGVDTVGYNELLVASAIENDDDNSGYSQSIRCAFAVVDYYQAIPAFDEVLSGVSLSDVTVAVVDSGMWIECNQFDEIMPRTRFIGLNEGVTSFDYHLRKHGTNIAALIAADNDDDYVNGIALRVLGDNLNLIVGNSHIWDNVYSLASTLANTREAAQLGADIVVLSLGRASGSDRPNWLLRAQNQFSRIFDASPQTLFIAAAGNDGSILDANDAPAGMPNANVLTVGGHQSCDPTVRFSQSCIGPGVELAAPATSIPGLVGDAVVGTGPISLEGNSFAAPIVASIAAIVKSIDSGLSGAQLKEFLLEEDHTWPAAEEVSGRRVALIRTAGTALLTSATGGITVDKLFDSYGPADNITDPSGYIANRMVGQIHYTISGSFSTNVTLNAPEIQWSADQYNYGIIGMGNQVVFNVGGTSNSATVQTTSGFRLNEPIPGTLTLKVPSSEGDLLGGVDDNMALLTLTECELTTRSLPLSWYSPANPGPDQLIFIEVTGSYTGTAQGAIRISDGEHLEGESYQSTGTFTTAFTLIDPSSATLDYMERNCIGGYHLGESE